MGYTATVRYGKMVLVAKCRTERDDLRPRDRCVVRTDRGKELGTLLTAPQPLSEGQTSEGMFEILRKASADDVNNARKIEEENRIQAKTFCREQVRQLNLTMKIVEVDYLLGGDRVIFYFTSEIRVDFHELVRRLAREYRTRVELRQIGGRDEARLVGDCGHCGLTLCCRGFIKELGGISMDMAKLQKHTTDPSKITGRCGKLLCCLRYEYNAYTEARDLLPPRGTQLLTRKGEGRVIGQNLLLREVTIETPAGEKHVVKLDEISGAKEDRVAGCNGCDEPKGGEETKGDAGRSVVVAEPEPPSVPDPSTETTRTLEEETKIDRPIVSQPETGGTPPHRPPDGGPPRGGRRRRRRGRGFRPPGAPGTGAPPAGPGPRPGAGP